MKILFCLLLLIVLLPLRANDILANGDFANGAGNWHGDGRAAQADPNNHDIDSMMNPAAAKGIVVTLKPHDWTYISQNFSARERNLDYSFTYLPANCALTSPAPPLNRGLRGIVQVELGEGAQYRPGDFFVGILDRTERGLYHTHFKPVLNARQPQVATGSFTLGTDTNQERTLILIFPPGTGTITLTNASLTPSQTGTANSTPIIRFFDVSMRKQ